MTRKTKEPLTDSDQEGKPATEGETIARTTSRNEAHEEADFQRTAGDMKAMLAAQPKVAVFIPLENGEPKGTQFPVEINGHRMNVPKGVPNVQVPQAVAEIIWRSLGIYEEASSALRSQNDASRPVRLDLQNEQDRTNLDA
jgi:hypothetical protein